MLTAAVRGCLGSHRRLPQQISRPLIAGRQRVTSSPLPLGEGGVRAGQASTDTLTLPSPKGRGREVIFPTAHLPRLWYVALVMARAASVAAPSCTVVVCTRDRPALLDACFESLTRLSHRRFDVLVVDNAPSDPETRRVARRRGVRYVVEPALGLSRARNRGARSCGSEIVAYLDDDALAEPRWLSELALEFADERVMAAAGRICPTELVTEAEQLFELSGGFTRNREARRVVDWETPGWFALASFGGIGTGGNMAFRREAFERWPGFDERLGCGSSIPGGEEHQAFFSLIARGYRVIYTPNAIVRHPYPRTMSELRARHLRTVAASAAHLTRFLVEEPSHRGAALAFLASWLAGTTASEEAGSSRPRLALWWQVLGALFSGPLLYARSGRASSENSPSSERITPLPRADFSL